ncbi:MAG: family 10 glycosylhydrolase [Armatimonadota bacterium]|nr:family 10 glycosylhydrolase [Armatimonadota bacterium]
MDGTKHTRLVVVFVLTLMLLTRAGTAAAAGGPHVPSRALWIETSANLLQLRSREAIRDLVARARAAGIDTLIPEAKNAWGFVIYESAFAPHIRTSPVPRATYPAPATWFPRDFDPLRALIEEAHAAGLRVHAAVNAFGEGLRLTPASPLIGVAASRPEWITVHLRPGDDGRPRFVPASEIGPIVFVNAAHPEVQSYELGVLWEVVSRYAVDGIILDRARYTSADADFSDLSRRRFEAYLGGSVVRWPDDVATPARNGIQPGPLYPAWMAWRASVIQAYVRAAGRLVRGVRPGTAVGMYVGSWVSTLSDFGQNWTRPDAPALFAGWSPALAATSVLPELDYLMVGLYFPLVTRWEAVQRGRSPWATVIGRALHSRELTRGTPLLGSIWLDLYQNRRPAGTGAIRAAVRLTDGVMLFDLTNVASGDWWSVLGTR